MTMEITECQFESYIRKFINERTQEKVELVLSKDMEIRPIDRKGSILLAVFWVKVLQHPKNFPSTHFPYQKIKLPGTKADHLIVRVDDLVITVDMATGKLTIQGGFVCQWFKDNFISILQRYDPYCHPEKSWSCNDFKLSMPNKMPLIPEPTEIKPPVQYTDDYSLPPMRRESSQVPHHLQQKIKGIHLTEELISGVEDVTVDKMGILTGQKLQSAIREAKSGGIQDGFARVYRLWKSLLYKWFSTGARVTIVTTLMDAKRLKDIVTLFILFRNSAKIDAIHLPRKSDEISTKTMLGIQQEVLYDFPNKLHPYIEYMVFRKITYPIKNFHASFIAGAEKDTVSIFHTSASFHSKYFRSDTMEFVNICDMTAEDFQSKLMTPLASQVVIL